MQPGRVQPASRTAGPFVPSHPFLVNQCHWMKEAFSCFLENSVPNAIPHAQVGLGPGVDWGDQSPGPCVFDVSGKWIMGVGRGVGRPCTSPRESVCG